jgi:hypothetical protein
LQTSNQIAVGIQDLNLELFCSKLGKSHKPSICIGEGTSANILQQLMEKI